MKYQKRDWSGFQSFGIRPSHLYVEPAGMQRFVDGENFHALLSQRGKESGIEVYYAKRIQKIQKQSSRSAKMIGMLLQPLEDSLCGIQRKQQKSLVLRMQVHSSHEQYRPVNFRPDVSSAQWKK